MRFDFLSNEEVLVYKYNVPMKDKEKKKENKTLFCVVCGAKALGYNFDQITCESCKAFFRRNALKNIDELRCRFSGNCNISIQTRRQCPHCRIKKCFDVGMRKEWIQSEDEKRSKRVRTEKIRRRKYPQRTIEKEISHNDHHLIDDLVQQSNISQFDSLVLLTDFDRTRLNNITHCYDQYSIESSQTTYVPCPQLRLVRLDELYNRKIPIFKNFISLFKQLPEMQHINLDDQVTLIKQNIRIIIPLNYAMLRAPDQSPFRTVKLQTINCYQNANVHEMLRALADIFVDFVHHDPLVIKLLIIILFFSTNSLTTRSIYDPGYYQQLKYIQQVQTSYLELLWSYLYEKYGETQAILLYTHMITKYLHVLTVIDQVDQIIQMNTDMQNVNLLMKTLLQLT